MGKLSGKNAIVTGAARGLGREYALRLASLGANVGVIDINLKSFEEYTAEKELLTADT
ncbi:MAG: SDR family NAD(P)-dependent oxidoreductase, partial [Faecalispora jeddahensis]